MAEVKAGPAFIFIQALDAAGDPTGDITNLQYLKNVKTTFKPKKYEVRPDNAPGPVEVLPLGLEVGQITTDLISQSAELYRIALSEASGSLSGDVLSITGMSLGSKYRVCAIYPDIIANSDVSIYQEIDSGGALTCDVFEMRYADLGGEEVSRDATPESESMISFVAKAMTKIGITAVPAKYQEGYSLTDASVLNQATPATWPITTMYA